MKIWNFPVPRFISSGALKRNLAKGKNVSEPEYHEVQLSGSVKSIVGYNLTTNPAGARDSPAVFLRQAMSAGKTYGQTAAA